LSASLPPSDQIEARGHLGNYSRGIKVTHVLMISDTGDKGENPITADMKNPKNIDFYPGNHESRFIPSSMDIIQKQNFVVS